MFRSSNKCVRLYLFRRWFFLLCYYLLLVLRWRCCTELVTEYIPIIIIIIITEKVNSFLGFGFFWKVKKEVQSLHSPFSVELISAFTVALRFPFSFLTRVSFFQAFTTEEVVVVFLIIKQPTPSSDSSYWNLFGRGSDLRSWSPILFAFLWLGVVPWTEEAAFCWQKVTDFI